MSGATGPGFNKYSFSMFRWCLTTSCSQTSPASSAFGSIRCSVVHLPTTLAGGPPVMISGLVQNFQAAFEDRSFCREAFMWCLLLVARVGQSRGNSDVSSFLFPWTGLFGLSEPQIVTELGLV